jgi:hypothetical protein
MNNRNQVEQVRVPKHRGRGCLAWLGGIVALVLGLMAAGLFTSRRLRPQMRERIRLPVRWWRRFAVPRTEREPPLIAPSRNGKMHVGEKAKPNDL